MCMVYSPLWIKHNVHIIVVIQLFHQMFQNINFLLWMRERFLFFFYYGPTNNRCIT